jgi:hypothetical protein
VALVLSSLNVKFNEDITTNILNSLYAITNNFQNPTVSSRTFELAAACLNAGGKRFQQSQRPSEPAVPDKQVKQAENQPNVQPVQKQSQPEERKPVIGQDNQPKTSGNPANPKSESAPADWLKPKIFKSSNQA